MANIITDVSGVKNVRMTNSNFARPPIPAAFTNWSILRVALLLRLSDSGANITGTPRLAVGLCSGSANIIGDATTTHFVGVMSNNATWSRATAGIRYTSGSTWIPHKKVGTTITNGTNISVSSVANISAEGPTMLMVDITKGTPNYTINLFMYAAAAIPTNTDANFELQAVSGVPTFTNYVRSGGFTIAVDEATDGVFDHACVWWNQTNPTLDVLNWGVYRVG